MYTTESNICSSDHFPCTTRVAFWFAFAVHVLTQKLENAALACNAKHFLLNVRLTSFVPWKRFLKNCWERSDLFTFIWQCISYTQIQLEIAVNIECNFIWKSTDNSTILEIEFFVEKCQNEHSSLAHVYSENC